MSYQRYNLEPQEVENPHHDRLDLQLLYISRCRYDDTWPSIMHSHPFTELFYVVNGSGLFQSETETFRIQTDDLVLINPNIMHTEFSTGNEALEYVVLGLDGLFFRSPDYSFVTYRHFNEKNYRPEFLFYTKALIQELHDKGQNYVEVARNLLENLVYLIERTTEVTPNFETSNKVSQECRFIEQYLDEHFSEDITLDSLSALTFRNKYYIAHAFTKYKGVSPINYLIDKRIEESKSLLANTNYPIAKIAQSVGFSSQSYFSQVFRKEVNMTPGAYRKQCEEKKSRKRNGRTK